MGTRNDTASSETSLILLADWLCVCHMCRCHSILLLLNHYYYCCMWGSSLKVIWGGVGCLCFLLLLSVFTSGILQGHLILRWSRFSCVATFTAWAAILAPSSGTDLSFCFLTAVKLSYTIFNIKPTLPAVFIWSSADAHWHKLVCTLWWNQWTAGKYHHLGPNKTA